MALGAGAQTPAPAEPSLPYTVQASDKLIKLARDLLRDPHAWPEVARHNRLPDVNRIRPGQVLQLPLRLLRHQPLEGRLVAVSGDVALGSRGAQVGDVVREGDRLQTGANSSAVVALADGSRAQLLPQSLAEVVQQRHYSLPEPGSSQVGRWYAGLLRLARGNLELIAEPSARRAEPMRVVTPTSLVGVRGTTFRVAHDADTALARAEVTSGRVRTDNLAQGSGVELPSGTGVLVDPTRAALQPVALLPAPDVSAQPSALTRPAVAWPLPALQDLPGAVAWRVQVARDASFGELVRSLRVASDAVGLADLADGTWHVRIRGIDAQGLEGLDARTQVRIDPAPPPPAAPRLSLLHSVLTHQSGSTRLRWLAERDDGQPLVATGWRLVLARDTALTQDRLEWRGEQPDAQLPALPADWSGYVTLHARLADGSELTLAPLRFVTPPQWGQTVFDSIAPLRIGPAGNQPVRP